MAAGREPWRGSREEPGWTPRIPDHEVVRVIGEGSHGQVWLARSVLGAWRAVKVVRRGLFEDARPFDREFAGVQRFEPLSREDEGFVDVLHTGRNDAEGYFYYLMELADDASSAGEGLDPETYAPRTLASLLSEVGRIDVERCVQLGLRLASALGRLHRAGLIHRDVKPSNIVFVGGQPKLADIGLVVEQSEARSFVGTDGYIPPEGPNSAQADLYSLGMVLYEAGMGQRRHDFPRPCDAMDGGSDAGVLRELNAVLLRACAAVPGQRYVTAEELSSDLAFIASGGSVRRRHQWRRRRRAMVAASASALVGLAAWAAWAWQRAAWIESGRRARLDEQEQRVAQMHLASAARAVQDGDDSMGLLWLAQVIASKESRSLPAGPERVLAGQLQARMPRLRSVLPVGGGLFSVGYSPDGSKLVTSDDRGFAIAWDPTSGRIIHGPVRCGDRPVHVQMTGQGAIAWASSRIEVPAFREPSEATGFVRWVDLATGQENAVWDGAGWAVSSPDHRWLATADSHFRVGLGRADGVGGRRSLAGHSASLEALVFSPDASLLASGSDDQTVRVWRVPEGMAAGAPIRVQGRVRSVSWGPDSRSLVTLAEDDSRRRTLEWWDVGTGERRLPPSSLGGVGSLLDHGALHGQSVVLASGDNHLSVLRASDGTRAFRDLPLRGGRWRSWALGQDGLRLLVGNLNGEADVWSMEDGRVVGPIPRHPRAVRWVGFHPSDGSWFTAAEDGLVRVWEWPGSATLGTPGSGRGKWGPAKPRNNHWDWRQAAWNQRGDTLVTVAAGPQGHDIVAMDTSSGSWTTVLAGLAFASGVTVVAAPEGDAWVVDGLVSSKPGARADVLWVGRGPAGWEHRRLPHPAAVVDLQLPRPGRVVTVDDLGVVRSWDARDGRVKKELGKPSAAPIAYVLSPDGRTVAAWDGIRRWLKVQEWEGAVPARIDAHVEDSIWSVSFVGGSDVLTVTGGLASAHAWDLRKGKLMEIPREGVGNAKVHDWHAPTQRLLLCPDVGPAMVLDLATRQRRILGGAEVARAEQRVAFSPDGRWILARDFGGTVRVFDAGSGQAVTPPLPHLGTVWWAGISASNVLVTLSAPDLVQRWTLEPCTHRPDALLREAEILAGRTLDSDGRESWLGSEELVRRTRSRDSSPSER